MSTYKDYGSGVYVAMGAVPEPRSILDNPNISLNDPATWEAIFGDSGSTHTGDNMTHERAFSFPAFWQACEVVAGGCAKIPVKRYQQNQVSGIRNEVEDDALSELLLLSPNEQETAFPFWRRYFLHAAAWGNGYAWIERDGNRKPIGLYTLLPDRTRIEQLSDGFMFVVTETSDNGGRLRPIPLSDVIHTQGLAWRETGGIDLTAMAKNTIALGLAQEKFSSKFFKHGGRVGGVLEIPASATKQARDNIEEGWRKTYEDTDAPFKTVVLRDNAKFHAAQQSPSDAQLSEATEGQVRQVCRFFNLAPSKLGLSDATSYASKGEDNGAFVNDTLSPWLIQRDQQATLKLQSASERRKYWFSNDPSELLSMKPQEQAVYLTTLTNAAIMSKNEARRTLNMEPYEGGDSFENPNTSSSNPQKDAPLPGGTSLNGNGKGEKKKRAIYAIGVNARYKAKNPRSFLTWIDGGMKTARDEMRDATGSEETVDMLLVEFKRVAEKANEEELPIKIDEIMQKYEKEA